MNDSENKEGAVDHMALLLKKDGPYRRTGRTTRIVDDCIQKIFESGSTRCVDHFNGEFKTIDDARLLTGLSKMIADRVSTRLQLEHKMQYNIHFQVELNGDSFVVSIKKEVFETLHHVKVKQYIKEQKISIKKGLIICGAFPNLGQMNTLQENSTENSVILTINRCRHHVSTSKGLPNCINKKSTKENCYGFNGSCDEYHPISDDQACKEFKKRLGIERKKDDQDS